MYLTKVDAEGVQIWSQNFGDQAAGSMGYAVKTTEDGGYVVAGELTAVAGGDTDFYLAKTDGDGNVEFEKAFGTEGETEAAHAVVSAIDGGYALIGHVGGMSGTARVVKTDPEGAEEWAHSYDELSSDMRPDMQQTTDGGYILVGNRGAGAGDATLVKVSADGETTWTESYDVQLNGTLFMSVRQTPDTGYVVATYRLVVSGNQTVSKMVLIKTAENGTLEWIQDYEEGQIAMGIDALQTADGGYVLTGYYFAASDGVDHSMVIKTGPEGDEVWRTMLGADTTKLHLAFSVQEATDGGYVVAGITTGFDAPGEAAMLAKISQTGDIVWTHAYDGSHRARSYSVERTDDDGYILVGGVWD
ncbi:MAG: hypothetical protein V3V08_09155 [Nannocystaceae bacterium]